MVNIRMLDLDLIAQSCGVLVRMAPGVFDHLGTAWSIGPGEWVTAWSDATPPGDEVRLISARNGAVAGLTAWECEDGVAGFTSIDTTVHLTVERDAVLNKRMRLAALGYPCMIDHPAFRLHRGSLNAERYYPYLCPWTMHGHVGLFNADDGFLTGRIYPGMAGGPVLDEQHHVVGLLLDGGYAPEHPPLTRFRRLA